MNLQFSAGRSFFKASGFTVDDGRGCGDVGCAPADACVGAVFFDGLEHGQVCERGFGLFWQKFPCGRAGGHVDNVCDHSRAAGW